MYHIRIHDKLQRSKDQERIQEVVLRIISDYGKLVVDSSVDIHLVNDAQMAKLGLRGDPLTAGVAQSGWDYEKSPTFFGELHVNTDRAAREAPQNGCSVDDEILIYVVYGTLRWLGCHETFNRVISPADERAYAAEAKQRLLEKEASYGQIFGLAHPYQSVGESDDYKPGAGWTVIGLALLVAVIICAPCLAGLVAIWSAGWLAEAAIVVLVVLCVISFGIPIREFFSRKR